ncbi:hypothetical protein B0O99DRAFT_300972 [Bisporella sp. PMI_857]|nr:hypothetical protein B0O99DRAFT_300972 [Bisporella sp. PMI_857]
MQVSNILNILSSVSWFSLSMLSGVIGVNIQQRYRPVALASLIGFALLAFRNISDRKWGFEGTESFAMFVVIYLSHMTCVLIVEQYQLPSKSTSADPTSTILTSIDWRGGYKMLFNARWLGTPREAPGIHRHYLKPPSSPADEESIQTDQFKPLRSFLRKPRTIFLRDRLIALFTIFIMLQAYNYIFMTLGPRHGIALELTDFLPTKFSYFRRLPSVTLRETLIRFWLVGYWTFYSIGLYKGFHDVLALIFVGSGLDEPEDWPRLFGSIKDATSIRNFWAKTWHRLVYRSYTSYGAFISKHILRLPRSSFVGKMFINLYVFAMSGFAHAIAVRQLGFSCGFWEEVRFYCSGFAGILIETAIIAAWKRLSGGYKMNPTVSKIIGYVWVFTYLFTTIPKSQYPKLWCVPA